MFASRTRNFIFLHVPKTAGSSISMSLARDMAPDDIMIGCWSDAHRHHIPYNALALRIARENGLAYTISCLRHLVKHGYYAPRSSFVNNQVKAYFREKHGFSADAHSPACVVRDLDPDLWQRAFKFAFVRNPWTHAVSNYKWCTRNNPKRQSVPFKEFLLRTADISRPDPERVRPIIISNWDVFAIGDEIVADFIGRFENLETDLEKVSRELGFDVSVQAIGAKREACKVQKTLADYYDEESIALVRQIYHKEIDAFSYTLPF